MNLAYYALKVITPKVLAFEESTKDPMKAQRKVLMELIKRNKDTEYGLKYGFGGINTIEEYQKKVPLADCETMRPYIERMTKGEENILVSDKVIFFSITSGSTGYHKFVPATKYSKAKKSEVVELWSYYISRDHPDVTKGKIFAIISPEKDGETEGGIPYGAESGHGYKSMPDVIKKLYAVPYEVFEIQDYDARYYAMLRFAIEKNVTTVATMTPSTIVLLCQKIKKFQDRIIDDIEKGAVCKRFSIEEGIRSALKKIAKPNPKRAGALKKVLKEKGELLPKYFWPDMQCIECWKRGTVGIYLKEFPAYFGDVPVRDFGYFSSEARCSIPMSDEGAGGALAINANFYEFIPKDDRGEGEKRVLLSDQLEKGKEYFIVLTTPGGLYRYNIDDLVRVEGFFNKTPVIEFVQKGLNVLSVTGEKLYEAQVATAVSKTQDRMNLMLEFFTACVEIRKLPRYVFVVEFSENPGRREKEEFLKTVEEELRRASEEYEFNRRAQELDDPVLKVVKKGGFEKYRARKVKDGMHDGQFKLPQLTSDLKFQENFEVEEEIFLGKK